MDFPSPPPLSKIEDYDAIGFDVDHCLTRYHIRNLTKLMYDCMIEILQSNCNYPSEVFISSHKDILNFGMTSIAVDVEKGNCIKLGLGFRILRAYNGTDRLSEAEIKKNYGEEMILPKVNLYGQDGETDVYICVSLFEHVWAVLFAQCIQFKKTSPLWAAKTHQEIKKDLYTAFHRMWVFWNYQGKVHEMQTFSLLFKEICQNVEKYVYPQPELREILAHLKKQGKFLFIASNSPYNFIKVTLDYGLGKNWEDLFDLVVSNAEKPSFFKSKEKPFFEFNVENLKYRGDVARDLKKCKYVVEGNVNLVEKVIEERNGTHLKRKIFVGDNLICDNFSSLQNEKWDTIHLFEESQDMENGKMMNGLDFQEYWGSYFHEESNEEKLEAFWPNFVRKNCSDFYPFLLCEKFKNFVNF